jgi:hypothetical protein
MERKAELLDHHGKGTGIPCGLPARIRPQFGHTLSRTSMTSISEEPHLGGKLWGGQKADRARERKRGGAVRIIMYFVTYTRFQGVHNIETLYFYWTWSRKEIHVQI